MTARHNPLEQPAGSDDSSRPVWKGPSPLAEVTPDVKTLRTGPTTDQTQPLDVTPVFTPGQDAPQRQALEIPPIGGPTAGPPEIPAPIQDAIKARTPIRFSSAGENQQANRQPDYFFTPEGQLVPNPKAQKSADGSINIQVQSKDATNNKSLRDAITHESDMQKAAAKDMIRLWQKEHPNETVPGWMNDLASAKPNIPDFVPFPPTPNAPIAAPPENGFVPRGVSGGGGGGGGSSGGGGGGEGFAGNGGFDGGGNFRGSGGAGDGTLSTGGPSSSQPLGPGEQVKAKDLYDYMSQQLQTEMKLSPEQAKIVSSGILGNMQTESSFNTKAFNAGEGAIGLAQWEGGRRTQLEAFANSPVEQAKAKADGVSNPVLDYKVQVDFMIHELKTNESGAWGHISGASSPGQAAAAFDQYYERSSGAARGQRVANADNIYNTVAKNA